MKPAICRASLCACLLLAGCASEPDHFYALNTLPEVGRAATSAPTVHVLLSVSVPSLVDRAEMVISTSESAILVLDHERWAVPLSEQVSQTLARDIERRRDDVLVGDRGFDQASSPPVLVKVDIVRMSAQQGESATIEAHWRIEDGSVGTDLIGSDRFKVPLDGKGFTSVAKAYSQALSGLADTLTANLGRK